MDFEQVMRTRFSCRKFTGEEVAGAIIEKILELAQHSASWCNVQPWQLILLSGQARRRFAEALWQHLRSGVQPNPDFTFPEGYYGIYRERRKVCGVQLYESLGIGKEDKARAHQQALENFRFFDAPHVALLTTEAFLGVYGAIDCGVYINGFMLAARNFGVDSIAQASLASYPEFVRSYFGLPENRKLVCGITFGYAQREHPINQYRTERAPTDEVVRWEC